MKKTYAILLILVVSIAAMTSCAVMPRGPETEVEIPVGVVSVDNHNFQGEITEFPGAAIVVFYNTRFWQAVDMRKRVEWLAEKYPGHAKFAAFQWRISDDPGRFGLEMLPTVILYRDGSEIDRIKGIPPEEKQRRDWNDDLELWFLVNALKLQGHKYSGDFYYLFKNGYSLHIGNY